MKSKNVNSGLIGHPLGHSISPVIHEYLGHRLGIDVSYDLFDTEAEALDEVVTSLCKNGIKGVNVTIPYKTGVIKHLSYVDAPVKNIGACNTIVCKEDGLYGYNTDYSGLSRALSDYGLELKDKKVAILGAGGASKAVRYLCSIKGAAKIYIFNRTVREEGILPLSDFDKYASEGFDLIIQTTSVGMYPDTQKCVIEDEKLLSDAAAGFDLIYNPLETVFMKSLRSSGKFAYNGLRMLLYQGVEAFKLINNVNDVPHDIEMDCFLNMLISMKRVLVLCGMMGCGKSTVGKRLCKESGYKFIDTDDYIVNKMGMSINDIFEKLGEPAFRDMEYEALGEIKELIEKDSENRYVISLGGGMCQKRNIPRIKTLGTVVYLRADAETLAKRVARSDDRPLLKDVDRLKTIKELLNKRESLYMEASDEIVDY
ncbi:MAG: AAA family ATPase [Lachnospiraceae bacterium]|nr:AAA family ATPase [Lachnospiraceae bacterium]